jgi:hypothetical protein
VDECKPLVTDRTLEAAAYALADAFPPHERFRANCALCIMLQVTLRPSAQCQPLARFQKSCW